MTSVLCDCLIRSRSYSAVGDGEEGCLYIEWIWYEVEGHYDSQSGFIASSPIALNHLLRHFKHREIAISPIKELFHLNQAQRSQECRWGKLSSFLGSPLFCLKCYNFAACQIIKKINKKH